MSIEVPLRRMGVAILLTVAFVAGAAHVAAAPVPMYRTYTWQAPIFQNVTSTAGVGALGSLLTQTEMDIEKSAGFLNGGRGVCASDFDSDGDDDIFVVGPRKDQIFRNDGALQFTEMTASSGIVDPGYGMGCTSVDLDNDGDEDIIATNWKAPLSIWRNNGNWTFTNMTSTTGINDAGPQTGVAAADFDNDGLVDFFLSEYLRTGDRIYRNLGGWKFEDKTDTSQIADLDHSFQPVAADYDGDGDQDVYVAVDFGPDTLWENAGDFKFADVSIITGAYDVRGGMGAAWGDWNNDGDLDMFVTNYDEDGLWDNNNGTFTDIGNSTGTDDAWTSWGVAWVDFDLDGDLDLYYTNGVVDYGTSAAQPNKLFRNDGNGAFTDVSEGSGAELGNVKRGLAAADFDGDGRIDFYVSNVDGPAALLHNTLPTTNGWLRVKLQGTVSNRDGIGAEVSVKLGSTYTKQVMTAGSSYLSSNSKTLVFGTGSVTAVPEVLVKWPSGLTQIVRTASANSTITIVETDTLSPRAVASEVNADQGVLFPLDGSLSSDNVRIKSWDWSVNVSGVIHRASGKLANMTIYEPASYTATLEVTDVFGLKDSVNFLLNVRPLMRVTVDAGADLSIGEGTTQQFVARGMSTATPNYEGDCEFVWTFNDSIGPQTLFGARPAYTFGRPGTYPVTVRVRDPQNATAQDTVVVTVRDAKPPSLHAEVPSVVDEDSTVMLDATATTDNDPTFSTTGLFTWTYTTPVGGGQWQGARVFVEFTDPGPISLVLMAQDASGNRATALYSVAVNDTTRPVPNAGPDQTAMPGQEIVLSAANSLDNDVDFLTLGRFEWGLWYPSGVVRLTGPRHVLAFDDPGLLKVELDVWDPAGNHASAPDIMFVRVTDDIKPVAQAGGDRTAEVGEVVPFSAAGTSDNDPTLFSTGSFLWEFQDGDERHALIGSEASYTFVRIGVYAVRLTVADESGNTGSVVFKVTVEDLVVPVLKVAPIPPQIAAGIRLVLDATESSDNGGQLRFLWRVEGPNGFLWQLAAARGEVVLTMEGTYTATVTAKDTAGNVVAETFTVEVVAPPPSPGNTPGSPGQPGSSPGEGGAPPMGGEGPGPSAGASTGLSISVAGLAAAAAVTVLAWLATRRMKR